MVKRTRKPAVPEMVDINGPVFEAMIEKLKNELIVTSKTNRNSAFFNRCCWNFSRRQRINNDQRCKTYDKKNAKRPHITSVRLTTIIHCAGRRLTSHNIKTQLLEWLTNNGYVVDSKLKPWTIGPVDCLLNIKSSSETSHDDSDDHFDEDAYIPEDDSMLGKHSRWQVQNQDYQAIASVKKLVTTDDRCVETSELCTELVNVKAHTQVKSDKEYLKVLIKDSSDEIKLLRAEIKKLKDENERLEIDLDLKGFTIDRLNDTILKLTSWESNLTAMQSEVSMNRQPPRSKESQIFLLSKMLKNK